MKARHPLLFNSRLIALVWLCAGLGWNLSGQSWTNTALPASQRATLLLNAMSFGQKAAMIAGASGPYVGNIPANPSLGIPALSLQDGPAGIGDSVNNVTALPAPIAIGASWDTALARQYGSVLGAEASGKGVEVLLAPMINMARGYEAGRNFEGYGEDPYLTAALGAAEVPGIQEQGVIATAKHFVCYEEETQRMLMSADVDERTRQEIYYQPFLKCVRSGAGAAMASYNRLNSRHACETEDLNAALKKQWGFNGWVMSDWGATFSTVAGMNNGMDMDMYCGYYTSNSVYNQIQSGNVPAAELDGMVQRILTAMFQFGVIDHPTTGSVGATVTSTAHAQFARAAAAEAMVLLQNTGGVLPVGSSVHSIAVIGSVASVSPISVGAGSAGVNLPYNVTPLAGITNRAGSGITVNYAQGDGASVSQAVTLASNSSVAIVCVGQQTSEGSDRSSLSLPNGQDALISAVAAANSNTIVVVYSSSATLMPWANQVAAVVMAWYPGQENGNALAEVLFGDVNPSGRLPVTIPAAASQVPTASTAQFPGVSGHSIYSEGLQIGYRWYDANNVTPLFAFGRGLSYTTFGYSNLTVSAVSPSGQAQIGFDLTNTGITTGAEVPQLYLGFPAAAGEPPRLLKGFQRISLTPGQTQHVVFSLTWEDLANWDATARGWIVTPGVFQVWIGASSRDLRLTGSLSVSSSISSSDLADAALHQPVSVSSAMSAGTPGAAAVDGDTNTTWTSLASDPQWIAADLGVTKDLSRVRLFWGTNYATSYQIQISPDDTNWTSIYSTNSGGGGTEDILVGGRGRYLRLYGTQRAGAGGYSLAELQVFSQPQLPFGGVVPSLPGRVAAANYDTGGEGVAYYNTTVGNPGGVYRSDDVGIQATSDTGGGYNVADLNNGEWLEYTVNPPDPSAIYSMSVRVAAPSGGGRLRVRLNGAVLGSVAVPNTGGYQTWQTVTLPNVPVAGGVGSQALRLEVLTNGFNVNWIELDRVQACSTNNIAISEASSASSLESSSYPASAAFDGDPTTRWSSAFSDPQWSEIDLGSVQSIARVRLIWENAFALSYSLQLSSDNSAWTSVYTTTNSPGSISDLAAVGSARYVRMYATQRATQYGDSLWEFEVYPTPQPASIGNITPASGGVFVDPSTGFSFNASSGTTTIPTNGVQLILNGIDVSQQLVFSGGATNWTVSFPLLQANAIYSYVIHVTNADGFVVSSTLSNAFDTFSQSNLTIEAEDFDFGNGRFIDNPVPTASPAANSYYMEATPAVVGVDLTTPNNISGEQFAYRNDSCGTQAASDVPRQKFVNAGVSDYNVGWWYTGAWLNYTRTFPTNNYYIYARLASDAGAYGVTNSLVTGGVGTTSQTTRLLGTFSAVGSGWQAWQWAPLLDVNGRPVVAALGGVETLKMTADNSLNANFYMFIPAPPAAKLTASLSHSSAVISIPTEPGSNYMLVYKNQFSDTYWKLLNAFSGDGTIKTIADAVGATQRFYRVVAQ
jgi:beta-glucosidase